MRSSTSGVRIIFFVRSVCYRRRKCAFVFETEVHAGKPFPMWNVARREFLLAQVACLLPTQARSLTAQYVWSPVIIHCVTADKDVCCAITVSV